MPFVKDPLTNVADAIIKQLRTDTLLAAYNWQEWDSDILVEAPRAYVTVEFAASIVEAGGPVACVVEVVLEGKPKRDKLSSVMGEIFGIITDPMLHRKLNVLAVDANNNPLIQFYRQAENLSVIQRVEGDIRVRRTRFTIQILPLG